MNYNTIVTPEVGLPCTADEAVTIQRFLKPRRSGNDEHGFQFTYMNGMGYLEAEQSGQWEAIPIRALVAIGALIKKAGLPHLECGAAFTAERLMPGSTGGTAFRILPSGRIVQRVETWPE